MSAVLLKSIHLSCVALSFALFFLRGGLLLRGTPVMTGRYARWVPHAVDTLLLVSAVWLAVRLGVSPGNSPWLLAKIVALLLYIALGSIALKYARRRPARLAAWVSAQLVFLYIVAVALAHDPLPWRNG
ncbi:MAG: SirB2 family protein [Gallionella sp.]|nr:SirB2 family protein [Gallionella sp.]